MIVAMNRSTFARILNSFGYAALYLQLLWVVILFVPTIVSSHVLAPQATNGSTHPLTIDVATAEHSSLGPIVIILTLLVIVGAVLLTAYAVAKGPGTVTTAGEDVTLQVATKLVPIVTHHKKLAKAQRRQLSALLQLGIKLSLSLFAFLLVFTTLLIHTSVPFGASLAIAFILLPWAFLWFSLAHLLRRA